MTVIRRSVCQQCGHTANCRVPRPSNQEYPHVHTVLEQNILPFKSILQAQLSCGGGGGGASGSCGGGGGGGDASRGRGGDSDDYECCETIYIPEFH